MVHPVLAAFMGAGDADLGAQAAAWLGEVAAARHECGGGPANLRAVHIVGDTARHHFYIFFPQAGCGAVVAGGGAGVTGFDAGFQLVGWHGVFLDR